jgi:hypothetical protein
MDRRYSLIVLFMTVLAAWGCRRAPLPAASEASPRLAPPRPPPTPPFTHPILVGRREEPGAAADCSRAALSRLAERVRSVDKTLRIRPHADTGRWLQETRKELIPRAAACVGRDGPLDIPWEMLHSAILSLEICADARQNADERIQRCRRAVDVAGRAEHGG